MPPPPPSPPPPPPPPPAVKSATLNATRTLACSDTANGGLFLYSNPSQLRDNECTHLSKGHYYVSSSQRLYLNYNVKRGPTNGRHRFGSSPSSSSSGGASPLFGMQSLRNTGFWIIYEASGGEDQSATTASDNKKAHIRLTCGQIDDVQRLATSTTTTTTTTTTTITTITTTTTYSSPTTTQTTPSTPTTSTSTLTLNNSSKASAAPHVESVNRMLKAAVSAATVETSAPRANEPAWRSVLKSLQQQQQQRGFGRGRIDDYEREGADNYSADADDDIYESQPETDSETANSVDVDGEEEAAVAAIGDADADAGKIGANNELNSVEPLTAPQEKKFTKTGNLEQTRLYIHQNGSLLTNSIKTHRTHSHHYVHPLHHNAHLRQSGHICHQKVTR